MAFKSQEKTRWKQPALRCLESITVPWRQLLMTSEDDSPEEFCWLEIEVGSRQVLRAGTDKATGPHLRQPQ